MANVEVEAAPVLLEAEVAKPEEIATPVANKPLSEKLTEETPKVPTAEGSPVVAEPEATVQEAMETKEVVAEVTKVETEEPAAVEDSKEDLEVVVEENKEETHEVVKEESPATEVAEKPIVKAVAEVLPAEVSMEKTEE